MDQEHFDRLTRTLGRSQTRRGVLRGVAGGLLAGAGSLMVGRNALADHTSDHCAPEGAKEQLNKKNPKSCCEGLAPDANGRCRPIVAPVMCPDAVIAGSSATDPFILDDNLQVFVGPDVVFSGADFLTSPIGLPGLANDQALRVVASNTTDPTYCTEGYEHLDAINLYCPSRGTSQVINPSNISISPAGGCGHVFFDETITVAL